jgi:S1-C subfamily serine protease
MITAAEPAAPAAAAGLMSHDIIVRLDGRPVTGVDDLIRLLNAERIDRAVTVEALRLGHLREFALRPVERRARG